MGEGCVFSWDDIVIICHYDRTIPPAERPVGITQYETLFTSG